MCRQSGAQVVVVVAVAARNTGPVSVVACYRTPAAATSATATTTTTAAVPGYRHQTLRQSRRNEAGTESGDFVQPLNPCVPMALPFPCYCNPMAPPWQCPVLPPHGEEPSSHCWQASTGTNSGARTCPQNYCPAFVLLKRGVTESLVPVSWGDSSGDSGCVVAATTLSGPGLRRAT